MPKPNNPNRKKNVVVRFHNLSAEMQDAVRRSYPNGFTESMMRVDKGPGDFFYAVVFETDDTNYLIKIEVNVDGKIEEEEEKDYYNDDIKGADEIEDSEDEEDADMED